MGDIFGGSSSSGDPQSDTGQSVLSDIDINNDGNIGSKPISSYEPGTSYDGGEFNFGSGNSNGSSNSNSGGTDWGGIISTGVGILGAGSKLMQQSESNKLARDQLKATTLSPEAKQISDATYAQNRQMMLAALQNFYARKGWAMPTGSGSASTNTSVPSVKVDRSGEIVPYTTQGAQIPTTTSNDEAIETGQRGTNGQQKAADNIGSVLPTNAKDAYQKKIAAQQSTGKQGPSTAEKVIQTGAMIANVVDKGQKIYNTAFENTINSGGSEQQASAAGEQAATQSGYSPTQILSYANGAMKIYRSLSDKNASSGQKAIGAAQGANQIYGAAGGAYAPYVGAALRGGAALTSGQGTAKDRATRAQQEVGLGIADTYTYGGASAAEAALRSNKTTGGMLRKLDMLDQRTNPATFALASMISGKSKDQATSDAYREGMKNAGIIHVEPGADHEEWNLHLRDKNGQVWKYDIGRDGGGGRAAHELDMSKAFEADGSTPTMQGRITGMASALGDLITGGDSKQGTKFAGYFANAVLNAAQGDEQSGRVAMRDLYEQMGIKSADDGIAGIKALLDSGKIDEARAEAQINSIRSAFGDAAPEKQKTEPERPQQKENGKGAAQRDMRSILNDDDAAKRAIELWSKRA